MLLKENLFCGTLRGRPDVLLVWINCLAYADRNGVVDRTFKTISDETGISVDRVRIALDELSTQDQETGELERLERLSTSFGWKIINYDEGKTKRREYMSDYMAQSRRAKKEIIDRKKAL